MLLDVLRRGLRCDERLMEQLPDDPQIILLGHAYMVNTFAMNLCGGWRTWDRNTAAHEALVDSMGKCNG